MRKGWKAFVVFTVMATVLAIPGLALAHHSDIDFDPGCLLKDGSFDYDYTVTAETSVGTLPVNMQNTSVEVWISYDGGAAFLDKTGAFVWNGTPGVYPSFTGSETAPAGTSTVTIEARPTAPWIDGTPAAGSARQETFKAPTELCAEGRITGGGSFFLGTGRDKVRYTHGFELHCDHTDLPNNLEINWPGLRFHLTELTAAVCTDDPSIDPRPPWAPFDTYHGWGIGRLNGVDGAVIEFTFTDTGQPGRSDTANVTITWPGGSTAVSNYLTFGNHQAHK